MKQPDRKGYVKEMPAGEKHGIQNDSRRQTFCKENNLFNLRFFTGILLILASALISEQVHLQFLIDAGGSQEGPGWFLAYSFCSNGMNTLLFVPIAVTFAAGGDAEEELHSRFALFCCIRIGKKQYIVRKTAGLIFSGGLMLCCSMLLMLGISCLIFGDIPILGDSGPAFSELLLQVLISFPRGFLNGALWAMVGGFSAVFTRNHYMAYAVPFILYYVLSVFQERYYRGLLFLNPRYWMAPVYYSDIFCIMVLLLLCILIGILFIWGLKRRLDDA